MDGINNIFKKYIRPNPNPSALSMAMVGLSTLMLVYFVAYKEDPIDESGPPSLEEGSAERSRSLESTEGSAEGSTEGSRSLEGESSSLSQQTTVGGGYSHSHGAAGTRGKRRNKKTKRRKL
jgi:hypothetical protein